MRRLALVSIAAGALAALSPAVAQPNGTNEQPVLAVIAPQAIGFSEEGLSGPGADMLRGELEQAQFIMIGEDHGFADSPALVAALALEAAPYGDYRYATETGPWTARWVRETLASSGVDGYSEQLQGRPLAIPFLSMREEAEVATRFLEEGQLWGIDQEFIGSPLIHLEWLAARADDEQGTVQRLLDTEKATFARGDQSAVLMARADEALWQDLRAIYTQDAEALALIDALEASQGIYRANFAGRGFDNNTDRVELIRTYFLDQYLRAKATSAEPPRVIFKMGATHAGRGTSPMKTFDIGSLIEGIAAGNGLQALHVAYLPIGGEQLGVRPSPEGAFAVRSVGGNEKLRDVLTAAGVDLAAIDNGEGHFVIALEPVRRALQNKGLNESDWMTRFMLLGFDYLVTTNSGRPGTPVAER